MRYGFAGIGVILFGMLTLMGIFYVLDGTVINEENYYSLKEVMESSMYDAIDLEYYHNTGDIKISEEKFVDVFTRRFIQSSSFADNAYVFEFYDIIESPPKASVVIKEASDSFVLSLDSNGKSSYDIYNRLTGMLIYNEEHLYKYERIAMAGFGADSLSSDNLFIAGVNENSFVKPSELSGLSCKIKDIEYIGKVNSLVEISDFMNNVSSYYVNSVMVNNFTKFIGINVEDLGSYSELVSSRLRTDYTIDKFGNGSKKNNIYISSLPDVKISFPLCKNNIDCVKDGPTFVGVKYNVTWSCNG